MVRVHARTFFDAERAVIFDIWEDMCDGIEEILPVQLAKHPHGGLAQARLPPVFSSEWTSDVKARAAYRMISAGVCRVLRSNRVLSTRKSVLSILQPPWCSRRDENVPTLNQAW